MSSGTTRRCPRCAGYPLEACVHDACELDVCPSCAGLWCAAEAWDPARLGERSPERTEAAGPDDELIESETLLHCPAGHGRLEAVRIAGLRGFEIDHCAVCDGVWFDQREWALLSAFRAWQTHRAELQRPTWAQWFFELLMRLPVEFNVRPRRTPAVVLGLIGLCAAVQLIGRLVPLDPLVLTHASLPGVFPLLTHMFVHGNLLHLLGNLYFLYILGDNVEDVLGHVGFLAFYLGCGGIAALAYLVASGEAGPGIVGASGAISGVVAAYLILFHRARLTFMVIIKQFRVPAWAWLGVWFGIQVLQTALDPVGARSGVAWSAHVAGFVAGALIVLPLRGRLAHGHPLLHLLETRRIDESAGRGSDAARARSSQFPNA